VRVEDFLDADRDPVQPATTREFRPVELTGARESQLRVDVDPRTHPRVVRVDPLEESSRRRLDRSAPVVERPDKLEDGVACPGW
jgi:hypothetical protein